MSVLGVNGAWAGAYQYMNKAQKTGTNKTGFAAQGLDYQPCGVVVHEDGSVTYIGGCADSPERVAEVNAINKAKREKEAAQRKVSMERSQEATEKQVIKNS